MGENEMIVIGKTLLLAMFILFIGIVSFKLIEGLLYIIGYLTSKKITQDDIDKAMDLARKEERERQEKLFASQGVNAKKRNRKNIASDSYIKAYHNSLRNKKNINPFSKNELIEKAWLLKARLRKEKITQGELAKIFAVNMYHIGNFLRGNKTEKTVQMLNNLLEIPNAGIEYAPIETIIEKLKQMHKG
jgi:hypothetical protein